MDKPFQAYEGDAPFFFVSYAHDDAMLVYEEMRDLHEAGFRLWYDDGIHVGSVWRQALADALSKAAGMIFFSTERSNASQNCQQELNFILDDGKPVIVVQLDATPLPPLLRLSLGDRQALRKSEFEAGDYRRKLHDALAPIAPPQGDDAVRTREAKLYVDISRSGDVADDVADLLLDVFAMLPFSCYVEGPKPGHPRDFVARVSIRQRGGAIRMRYTLYSYEGEQLATRTFADMPEDQPRAWQLAANHLMAGTVNRILACIGEQERDVDEDQLDALGLLGRGHAAPPQLTDPRFGREPLDRERLLDRAIAMDPGLLVARMEMVYLLAFKLEGLRSRHVARDQQRMLEHARRALVINEHAGLRVSIIAELTCGDLELASRQVERVMNRAPDAWPVQAVIAALVRLDRSDEAVALLEGFTKEASVDWTIAQAYTVLGDYETALDIQRAIMARAPDAPTSRAHLANILGHLGQLEEGRAVWASIQADHPRYSRANWERGNRVSFRTETGFRAMTEGLRKLGVD